MAAASADPMRTGTVCVTGGTRGAGYEAARQLAARFDKVIITSRTAASAATAVARLVAATGRPAAAFSFVVLDLFSSKSCVAAADALPALDALLLNAGCMDERSFNAHMKNGVTQAWQELVMGHLFLTEKLLADGKLARGARVVLAGTEGIRPVTMMTGFIPHIAFRKADIAAMPSRVWTSCMRIRAMMGAYGTAKLAGSLFMSKLAREHPELYIVTVSPGGMQSEFANGLAQPVRFLLQHLGGVMESLGAMHPTSVGAKRYLDAIVPTDAFRAKFKSGSVLGSPSDFFHPGPTGPLVDQRPYCVAIGNAELEDETARVVRAQIAADYAAGLV